MNKNNPCGRSSAKSRDRRWSGQSIVEFAIAAPVLALMLVAAADIARVFFFSVAVNNAARAGAQYGSQTLISAANTSGMETAATNDGSNIPGLTATASQCTCESPSGSVPACSAAPFSMPASYCTTNSSATFVQVDTAATFTTIVHYPGLPNSFTLNGQATMQVEQ
jgi:Flp pilus assembly protein TadG